MQTCDAIFFEAFKTQSRFAVQKRLGTFFGGFLWQSSKLQHTWTKKTFFEKVKEKTAFKRQKHGASVFLWFDEIFTDTWSLFV